MELLTTQPEQDSNAECFQHQIDFQSKNKLVKNLNLIKQFYEVSKEWMNTTFSTFESEASEFSIDLLASQMVSFRRDTTPSRTAILALLLVFKIEKVEISS